eukprot:CAMPEP_0201522686 /NCGR_PEP_ID=MMETSP0161_2-20130828/18494_1 /ASSEMBLY_ACC=CAM_ASM_000251 /TAXON_ID=180227 /ORGANISM="Neoparamoeba aestuarina, Strain SoJaBio B1-5/56/2" /LENGTH=327 /DNA_ID=CAMNT_0047921603 /DNA_START=156 /DNA_END=1139 /DNA_ORIENTATION=-
MVTMYWDTFGSDSLANGLERIADVKPGEVETIDTTIGHMFEIVESDSFVTLDLIEVVKPDQRYHIYNRVRQCGLLDNGEEESDIIPPTCSISILNEYHYFIRVDLPEYKRKQWIEPTKEIEAGRASFDRRRLHLNEIQPKQTPTFTDVGYKIVNLPENVWGEIKDYWKNNRHNMKLERWDQENHHVNHWQSPSYMLWLPHKTQRLLKIEAQKILEEWIGGEIPLEWTSLYGIRMYTNHSILLNHVDRSATHAVSAIIQVDQRVTDDWLLEVIGHDGVARHLKLLPGQMALYESASVVHGREKPLNGDYFANLFIHYRPKNNWNVGVL